MHPYMLPPPLGERGGHHPGSSKRITEKLKKRNSTKPKKKDESDRIGSDTRPICAGLTVQSFPFGFFGFFSFRIFIHC